MNSRFSQIEIANLVTIDANAGYGQSVGNVILSNTSNNTNLEITFDGGFVPTIYGIDNYGDLQDLHISAANLCFNPYAPAYGGNVGIGITNPQHQFDVNGSIGNSSDQSYLISNGGQSSYINGLGGYFGVATQSPLFTLDIGGDGQIANSAGDLHVGKIGAQTIWIASDRINCDCSGITEFYIDSFGEGLFDQVTSRKGFGFNNSGVFIKDANGEVIVLNDTSQVGILTSPVYTLDVNGSIGNSTASNPFFFYNGSQSDNNGNEYSYFNSANVGLFTQNPRLPLDVYGGAYFGNGAESAADLLTVGSNLFCSVALTAQVANALSIINAGDGYPGAGSAIDFFNYGLQYSTSAGARIYTLDDGNYGSSLSFATRQDGGLTNPLVDRLFINGNNGYIGINSISPNYTLDVNGSFNTSNGVFISGNAISSYFYPKNSNPSGYVTSSIALLTSGQQTVSGNKTFVSGLIVSGNLNLSPISSGINFALGNNPFYIYTGANVATGTMPLISGNNGMTYFIKNRGNTFTLTGSGSNQFFYTGAGPVSSIQMISGQGFTIINDGIYWEVVSKLM
jgi:hypothetical protein